MSSVSVRQLGGAVTRVQQNLSDRQLGWGVSELPAHPSKVVYLSTQQKYLEREYRHHSEGHRVLELFDSQRLQHRSQIPTLSRS